MVDDTYYITPHEAALAVVATAMKKSRLPFYLIFLNSVMGAFLFSAGGMLYVMCEAGSEALIPGAYMFVYIAQGAVYAIGLFYVIVCGMELFNSNILFFSVGVMRGAVTLMDLLISWWVSFWCNLAGTVFVVYVICYCSGVLRQENYVAGAVAIGHSKNSYTFAETLVKGIAGNFFVCLAVYLQIMVKPLHVKFLMIFLPIFTFVSMGFTHVVADMFLVPAAIFSHCGYGFGHYFWKIMLPGAIGNIIGGSFFGIVIPWFLHLHVIESDMKKLNLPAYEERDEQPMLNMDSRVVRVPTQVPSSDSDLSSIQEFKPDDENDISRVATVRSAASTAYNPSLARVTTAASMRSRNSKQIRSPKGVFPVVDMGEPLQREKTIASAYIPRSSEELENNIDDLVSGSGRGNSPGEDSSSSVSTSDDNDDEIDAYSGNDDLPLSGGKYTENPYDPEQEKVSSKLMHVISRTLTKEAPADLEQGEIDPKDNSNMGGKLAKAITRTVTKVEHNLESVPVVQKPPKAKLSPNENNPSGASKQKLKSGNKILKQFTFGGGGNDKEEIHRRLSNAKITKKAAGMSNDIAGIHVDTVDRYVHVKSKRDRERRRSETASNSSVSRGVDNDGKLGGPYASDRWKHFTYDYELDGERPVSFISEKSDEDNGSDAGK